jgi:hypothetical protein
MTSPRSFLAVMTGRLRRSRALHPNALQPGCGRAQGLATDSEPVVQVWGARARGFKGIFGVHSWIAVKPGGATEYTVYEVIGWRLEVDLPATAIGKDYIESIVSTAPSGSGFQFSLRGLLGVAASRVDGVEFNFLSLNFGVSSSGLKLPIIGRIGMPRIPTVIAVEEPGRL